jgi:hypothetical protein
MNTNNKPACYTKNSYVNMKVNLISNFAPLHNLNIYVQGHTEIPDLILSTFPAQTNMYYQALDLEGVVSQGPLYNNVNYIDYSYIWTVNKTSQRPPQPMNQSGPHKIYTTFQDPVDNNFTIPTNTLGLELVCAEYAQGGSEVHDILNQIMGGIYSENQIIYKPEEYFGQHPDPYDLYRANHGQCNSFARFFLVLSHSVGIPACKTTVFGGKYVRKEEVLDTLYYDVWANTCTFPDPALEGYLFTEDLIDPQGHTSGDHRNQKCDPYWNFLYHVIAIYPEISGSIGYDCVFNLSANVETDYGNWYKYYNTDCFSQDEPPPVPPDYYDHPVNTNPISLFEDEEVEWADVICSLYHPPLPPSEQIVERETPALTQYSSTAIRNNSADYDLMRYCGIGLGRFTDSILGNIWWTGSSLGSSLGRSEDKKYPGFYLIPPKTGSKSGLSGVERDTLNNLLSELLRAHLYSPQLIDFVSKYEDIFGDSTRDEFFGRTIIEENEISTGGWFGQFISLGIFADFEDVGSFLDKAVTSFKLPPVDKDKVAVYERNNKFVYSLKDRENMFILRGYNVRINCEFTTGDSMPNYEIVKVIELIKYYDEEFMP